MRSPTSHSPRIPFAPGLLVAGLLIAGGSGSQAHAQGHDHENPPGDTVANPSEETVAGVARAFLERPLPLNDALTRVPHQVATATEESLAYYQQGLSYHYLYHYLNAVRSFNQALRLDPDLLPAWTGLSRALAGLGGRDEGREVLDEAQRLVEELGEEADPRGRLLVELRALALSASSAEGRERYDGALERALEKHPDDIEIRMLHALRARGQERVVRLKKVLEHVPTHVGAHHQLIHTYEGMGRTAEAVAHGSRLSELAPTVAHGRHMYGHNLMRAGRVPEARREFAVADSLERAYFAREGVPEHYDWHHAHNLHLLALTHWHLGSTEEAEAVLRRRAELEDEIGNAIPHLLIELGHFLAAEGRGQEAVAVARRIFAASEPSRGGSTLTVQAHLLEAEGWLLQGEAAKAEEALAQVPSRRGGRGRTAAWRSRVEIQLRLLSDDETLAQEELEPVLEELIRDQGPDGWITSLLHLHALGWAAQVAGAREVAERVTQAMEEHDPTFQVRIPPPQRPYPASPGGGSARTLPVYPASGGISVDGRLSEPEWSRAPAATEFIQQVPHPGEPATLDTEVRVLMDEEAVYVGLRLHDPEPDSIVAQLARRGVANESDWIYVAFDSHLDRRTAFQFGVNAAGVKRDLRIVDDTRQDDSWDAVWDVAVARDEGGWTAEFRIPLSQLRFSVRDEEQAWGFNVQRVVARTGEVSFWAPVERASGSYVSSFGRLSGIHLSRGPRRVELMPYLTSRMEMAPGDRENPYYRPRDLGGGFGADLRVGVTPWLTLNATVNPDFGQVEADPSVVNLSAFEVFLPERRPFFVEGSEYFRTPGANLFYSRRIGRSPQLPTPSDALHADRPDRTTILGAGKLTGRSSQGWTVGVLNAVTAPERAPYLTEEGEATALVEPMTSYSFARLGRDFRGGETGVNVTTTATNRSLTDDPGMERLRSDAYAGGVDARHRFLEGRFQVEGTVHLSHVRGDTAAISRTQRAPGRYLQRLDADHLTFRPERTSLSGWSSSLRLRKVSGGNWRGGASLESTSAGFEVNDLGLQFSVDETWQSTWVGYDQFSSGRFLRSWSAEARQTGIWTGGGERIDVNGTLDLSAELHSRWRLSLWGMRHRGGIDTDLLRGGPAYFRPGNWMGRVAVVSDRRRSLSGNLALFAVAHDGSEGWSLDLSGGLLWRPSDRSEVRLSPSLRRSVDASRFVADRSLEGLEELRYVLAEIDRTTAALEARLSYALSPDLTLEFHARPFISSGRYDAFKAVVSGHAGSPDPDRRLDPYGDDRLQVVETPEGTRRIEIDDTGDGNVDIRLPHPDFNQKDLRSTAVVRWEFRPGSTLFLVWSHDRSRFDADGHFDPIRDGDRLWRADGRNVLAIKGSYRLEW